MSSQKNKASNATQIGGFGVLKQEALETEGNTKTAFGLPADLELLRQSQLVQEQALNNKSLGKTFIGGSLVDISKPPPPMAEDTPKPPPPMAEETPKPSPPMAEETPKPPPPMVGYSLNEVIPMFGMKTHSVNSTVINPNIAENIKINHQSFVEDTNQKELESGIDPTLKLSSAPLLGGRYVLKDLLGQGGFGEVYKATDTKLANRVVAIKLMNLELAENKQARALFHREAGILSRLSHSNIVTILDSGITDSGQPYLVIEYLEGVSLEDYINTNYKGLKIKEALRIAIEICRALNEAHSIGITHRDLKPDNVIIKGLGQLPDYQVKLLDFGISKIQNGMLKTIAGSHKTEGVLGTPYYMSPEQHLDSSQVDHRTDIYALGVMIYELISGQVPFDGKDYITIAKMHIKEALPKLNSKKTEVSDLNIILEKMTAKKLTDRYQSIDSVQVALEQLLENCHAGQHHSHKLKRFTESAIIQHKAQIQDKNNASTHLNISAEKPKYKLDRLFFCIIFFVIFVGITLHFNGFLQ